MITAMSLTNGTLTVIRDNGAEILTARNDHPKWTEIVEAYKAGDEALLQSLISLKAVVETFSVGQLSINATGVLYRNRPLHTVDAERVMAFIRDGFPFKPLANYIARKMANPSARAIEEMYNFLEHKNMPITDNGTIVAYKGVGNDFYSIRGNKATVVVQGTVNEQGQLLNNVGAVIEVERSSVDDNYKNHCSFGLHAGSLSYAKGWGPRVVLVEIDPADVVSVPDDCECQKLRCCKYKVIGEYTGPMPHSYAPEFSARTDADGNCNNCGQPEADCNCEDTCNGCGNHVDDCDCYDYCDGCNNRNEDCNCNQTDSQPSQATSNAKYCLHCGNVTGTDLNHCGSCLNKVPDAKQTIARDIREIVAEQLGIEATSIGNDSLLNNLGMDSLDAIELVMALEEKFGMEIPDEDAEKSESQPFSAIVDYIYTRLQPTEDSDFAAGERDGRNDRIQQRSPQYLAGDENGADSEKHKSYIEGYIKGYNA